MEITEDFIDDLERNHNSVIMSYAIDYWRSLPHTKRSNVIDFIREAIESGDTLSLDHANRIITRIMSANDMRRYAIFAAKQSLCMFENKYPDDDRPRKAINAAEAALKNDTKENRKAAKIAGDEANWCGAGVKSANLTHAAWAAADAAYAASKDYDIEKYAAGSVFGQSKENKIKILKYAMELLKNA